MVRAERELERRAHPGRELDGDEIARHEVELLARRLEYLHAVDARVRVRERDRRREEENVARASTAAAAPAEEVAETADEAVVEEAVQPAEESE